MIRRFAFTILATVLTAWPGTALGRCTYDVNSPFRRRLACHALGLTGTSHVASASKIWGKREHIRWLFQQNRTANPAPGDDPFPNGQYPE